MKTTLKIKRRTSLYNAGRSALTLQITRHRQTRSITTSYPVSSSEWNEDRQEIVIPENTSSERQKELVSFSRKLKKDMHFAIILAESMETHGDYSSQDFVCRFRELQEGQLFCEYISRKAESLNAASRYGTAHAYQFAAVSFLKFLGGKDIRIERITPALIKSYEHYLQTNNKSKNTISCYMRSLRAAYNEATNESKLAVLKKTQEKPFADVFTGNAKTAKRAISTQSLTQLAEVKLEESKKKEKETGIHSLNFSRDLFMFSFYTQGMSFTDMVNLKKENIRDNVIRYKRKKTGQHIIVGMEDCMKKIIARYADPCSDYLFPVLRGMKDDYSKWVKTQFALSQYNKNLKKIAVFADINVNLTGYVSRHSWASLASQEGIPIATISRGMGHESEKTTRIYISHLDFSDVNKANRQIISRVTTTAG